MPSTSKNKCNLTENQRFEKINGKLIRTIENLNTKSTPAGEYSTYHRDLNFLVVIYFSVAVKLVCKRFGRVARYQDQ